MVVFTLFHYLIIILFLFLKCLRSLLCLPILSCALFIHKTGFVSGALSLPVPGQRKTLWRHSSQQLIWQHGHKKQKNAATKTRTLRQVELSSWIPILSSSLLSRSVTCCLLEISLKLKQNAPSGKVKRMEEIEENMNKIKETWIILREEFNLTCSDFLVNWRQKPSTVCTKAPLGQLLWPRWLRGPDLRGDSKCKAQRPKLHAILVSA